MSAPDTPPSSSTSTKKNSKPLHADHRARLRERIMKDTIVVPEYELLELWLGYVYLRKDTKPLAKDLLERFGTIGGFIDAYPAELASVSGTGPALEIFQRLCREIIARYLEDTVKKKGVVTSAEIGEMARVRLAGLPSEEVWAAMLDKGHRLLIFEKIAKGSVDHVLVSPREVMEAALKRKAHGVILVHNHPGGTISPSNMDLEVTNRIRQVLTGVGLRLVDHIIVADGKWYSLSDDGLLG